jgi:IclR family transcriptional regulator, pca regulon regulatory protein
LFALRTAQENLFASHRACQPLGADVPEDAGPHTEYVQSLDRGLAVIRAFSARTPRLSIADVARQTGLTRAAARRFLHTLCGLGYVGVSGGSYYLRPRVLELGYAYLSSVSVAEIAQEHLVALAEELHESCSASVLDGADIVYIARAQTNRIMTISLTVGTRLPGYPTSMGRVLLAALPDDRLDAFLAGARLQALTEHTITDPQLLRKELEQVREQGWCAIDQELEVGVRSVAVPVRDADGRVVAAVNATAHAARVPWPRLTEEFLPRLVETARHINADLAARR